MPVTLYADEWRSPTHVDDLARASWELASLDVAGVYHMAGPERLSRLELGRILCALYHLDEGLIREAKRPPSRPRDTSLDSPPGGGPHRLGAARALRPRPPQSRRGARPWVSRVRAARRTAPCLTSRT